MDRRDGHVCCDPPPCQHGEVAKGLPGTSTGTVTTVPCEGDKDVSPAEEGEQSAIAGEK